MQVDAFWKHWKVSEDPFVAEEARDDPIYMRLMDANTAHPEFQKVFGQPDKPAAAVVFGEKGSGKTALRLLCEKHIQAFNEKHPNERVWVVRYDDLNPVLDNFTHSTRRYNQSDDKVLKKFKLIDHQDAILSLLVTRLIDGLLTDRDDIQLPDDAVERIRKMPRNRRADLAVITALYDQHHTGQFSTRWKAVRKMLHLSKFPILPFAKWTGLVLAAITVLALLYIKLFVKGAPDLTTKGLIGLAGFGGVAGLGYWAWTNLRLWMAGRRIGAAMRTVHRTAGQVRQAFAEIGRRDLEGVPFPEVDDHDSRYQLTGRLLDILRDLGYQGMIVLVDRMDEPSMINSDAEKMKSLVWPMLNNKFLQQDRVGVKLLLPIELRHLLRREDADFFQRARLDKQHMIDRLTWSGATLFDLCTRRLQACRIDGVESVTLTDLFDDDVSTTDLIDALDQMQQPRDAFKFIYQTIQEHCSNVPQDQPIWKIPKLTLNQVRKQQSQRVQELQRGLTPA
ncbi:MAG: hypothetical protein GC159_08330 [Phycisphaera sp.]|nr:hypothetical protein [Phycisphaera sp.]